MPLFDWDTESIMHVANKHFWIFWAVTAPLTVTTMAGVAGWGVVALAEYQEHGSEREAKFQPSSC